MPAPIRSCAAVAVSLFRIASTTPTSCSREVSAARGAAGDLASAATSAGCRGVTIVRPSATALSAKLCDVDPAGQSFLVAFEHEAGRRASRVAAGDGRDAWAVEFVLRPTSYVFKPGHRLRVSIAGGNFPYLWPTPFTYAMDVLSDPAAGSWIRLPVVPEQSPRLPAPAVDAPPALVPHGRVRNADHYWMHREATGRSVSFEGRRENVVAVERGSTLSILQHFTMAVDADHPAMANTRTNAVWRLERPTASVETRVTTITMLHGVHVAAEIDLDGMPFLRKEWRKSRDPATQTG